MTNKEVVEQLENIKNNTESLINVFGPDDAWTDEIIALEIAQKCVKKDKRSTTEFWKGVALGFISFVIFYALHNL